MEKKTAVKPLIMESFDKAKAASNSLPEDPELKMTVASLDAKVKQIDARVAELNGLVAKSDQEKNTSKAQMDDFGKSLEASKTEMDAVITQVAKLQGDLKATSEKLKTDTQSAATALVEVQRATQFVQRWTSDISFISEMQALDAQLESIEQAIGEKQTVVDTAEQKLIEAKKVAEQAARQKAEAEAKAESLKQQIMKLRGAL